MWGPARPIRALSWASRLTACTASSPPRMRKPKPVFSLSRCTSTSSYSGPEIRHLHKLNLQRQINLRLHRAGGTYGDSRRWPWTFHKGRRGQVCSGRIPLLSQAQMCGAVAGLGKVCRVAKLGQIGLPEGCHVGPTGQATMRRRTADGSFMWHVFLKNSLNTVSNLFWVNVKMRRKMSAWVCITNHPCFYTVFIRPDYQALTAK